MEEPTLVLHQERMMVNFLKRLTFNDLRLRHLFMKFTKKKTKIVGNPGGFEPDITSYDFDAPMDEAGDPTPKYFAIRELIKDYLPLPNITVPSRAPKLKLPPLKMIPKTTLLSPIARQKLARTQIKSNSPFVTFEKIDQFSGFVLYETVLPKLKYDPSILEVPKIHDRAIVLIDDVITLNENYYFSENPLFF